jgi:hypothetical protein
MNLFTSPHNEAFRALGALEPGQHWSAFDVPRDAARAGEAKHHSNLCALPCVFDCGSPRMQFDGRALWLNLMPRNAIGCETRSIDIRQITSDEPNKDSLAEVGEKFAASILNSMQGSDAERRARLRTASKFPRRVVTTTTVFERNPDVVAEVLVRAAGVCEGCTKSAPFLRKSDGSPYLEVHHRIPLAQGGEDSIENAIALCPNCHRGAHYG